MLVLYFVFSSKTDFFVLILPVPKKNQNNPQNKNFYVGMKVLTAVVTKSSIFWHIMPRSPLKVDRCFGGTFRFYLQGRIKGQEIIQPEACRTCWKFTSNRIHSIIFQKTEILKINKMQKKPFRSVVTSACD